MGQEILPIPHPEMNPGMRPVHAVVKREIEGWQATVTFSRDWRGLFKKQTLTLGLRRGGVPKGEYKLLPEAEAMEVGRELALQDVARYAHGITAVIVDELCTEKRGAA